MNYKIIILFLVFLFPINCLATSNGEIPLKSLFFYGFNFFLFAISAIFLVKKYLPPMLNQRRLDFLDYQERAQKLKAQNKSECLVLEKEIQKLIHKTKNLNQSVEQALNGLIQKLEKQENQNLENFNIQIQQDITRQKGEAMRGLKNRFLVKVMQQTKQNLQNIMPEQAQKKLNRQVIKKWEKL